MKIPEEEEEEEEQKIEIKNEITDFCVEKEIDEGSESLLNQNAKNSRSKRTRS